MDAPSDELKVLANQAVNFENRNPIILDWLRLFLGLPIATVWPKGVLGKSGKPDLMTDNVLVKEEFGGFDCDSIGDEEILVQFFINVATGSLFVQIDNDGMAEISDSLIPFGGRETTSVSTFLEQTGIPGFRGTWEQVLRKLIELNDLVAKQIKEVPDDLKKKD